MSKLYPLARRMPLRRVPTSLSSQRTSPSALPLPLSLPLPSSFATTASSPVADSNSKSASVNDTTKNNVSSANSTPSEVNKFSSFASHWWDSRANPLVGMNPIRIQFIREVVMAQNTQQTLRNSFQPLQNKRVLDIGCGGGLLTESLSRLGASLVVGVDASPQVVEVAKSHSFHKHSKLNSLDNLKTGKNDNNIRYIGGMTVEELAVQWQTELQKEKDSNNDHHEHELFDVITALEIIEHVPNPTSLLQSAISLLKPNGILFVSTINRTFKSYGLAIVAAEYISGKVPIGTHDWNKFFSPEEVERIVCDGSGNDNNFTMKQLALSGMVIQPPFVNLDWRLDPLDTDVNWIGAYQKGSIP